MQYFTAEVLETMERVRDLSGVILVRNSAKMNAFITKVSCLTVKSHYFSLHGSGNCHLGHVEF